MTAVAANTRGQTFMYGETVYLRGLEKDDARRSAFIRDTVYPLSPDRTESWITDDIPGDIDGETTLGIVRTSDDVLVGSIRFERKGYQRADLFPWVAPVFGERGAGWKAEALLLLSEWLVNERHVPTALVQLPATETIVIDRLQAAGFVVTTRLREKRLVDGQRVDEVILQQFNQEWVTTLGDPMAMPLDRTGTGEPRPVPDRPRSVADAPKNAWMIGQRVYLRPYELTDVPEAVLWNRRETESFHILGRQVPSIGENKAEIRDDEKQDPLPYPFFAVCERETDLYIGEVGLVHVDLINGSAETVSWFHRPTYRGSGYGSEAKHMLLEYAFNQLGLHMLESCVRFENTRSAAALRKQGYRDAGRIAWMSNRNGQLTNFGMFDLLATDWRALHPPKD